MPQGLSLIHIWLVNGAPVGIAVVRGSEYRFELVNPYYQSIAGGDVPMIGRRFQDVFPAAETGGLDRLGRVYLSLIHI